MEYGPVEADGRDGPRMRYLELKLVEVRGKSYELDMWMADGAPLLCTVPVMAMLINICCRQCITHGHASVCGT
ncbi:hypothetical protein A0H81_06534 [Grifola frondosa]|uniref:Uncharacterized protein n=1 Tax=Grifola frondosa TaxID=5627 RepID=A0A1C7MG24_GRIFR|nr:hypothetical protein A0H81_06534 [Grifola frondosa]